MSGCLGTNLIQKSGGPVEHWIQKAREFGRFFCGALYEGSEEKAWLIARGLEQTRRPQPQPPESPYEIALRRQRNRPRLLAG